MSQTLAIFVDQYRSLKARKMFWIVLGLSGLVVAAFGVLGINDKGLTIIGYSLGIGGDSLSTKHMSAAYFYKTLFSAFGIGFWLSWLAALLALISTAGIFPEFVSSGVIDLTLSKPISRIRLFLTQYAAGLLFVALQVTIFCVASFLVLGLRGGVWEPSLFIAIPLVVCFFSFLFAVCALLGVWTRSTIAAILLTLLFWFILYVLNTADMALLAVRAQVEQETQRVQREMQAVSIKPQSSSTKAVEIPDRAVESAIPSVAGAATSRPVNSRNSISREDLQRTYDSHVETLASLSKWSRRVYWVKTFLPKTSETVSLLERAMIDKADMPKPTRDADNAPRDPDVRNRGDQQKAGMAVAQEVQSRSVAWVLGSSLCFEAVVLAFACFIFCRRDF